MGRFEFEEKAEGAKKFLLPNNNLERRIYLLRVLSLQGCAMKSDPISE